MGQDEGRGGEDPRQPPPAPQLHCGLFPAGAQGDGRKTPWDKAEGRGGSDLCLWPGCLGLAALGEDAGLGQVGASSLSEVQRDDARVVLTESSLLLVERGPSHRAGRPGSAHCPAGVWTPDTEEDSPRLSMSSTAETGCRGLEPGSPRLSAQDEPAARCRCPQAGSGALEFGPRCV